jgi:hypothetical protein
MEIKSLPEHLQSIAEKVIAHIYGGSSIPEGIDELTDWFEDEGWDELVGAWSDEHIALKLQYLAESKFNDSELVGCEDVEGQVTDDLRLEFARKRINEAFESGDGYSCPSVHTVQLVNEQDQIVFLGWLVEVHGQLGHSPNYCGVYSNRDQFYEELRKDGFLFWHEKEGLTDQQILKLWETNFAIKQELTIDQVDTILADENLGKLVRSNLSDISRLDLIERAVSNLSADDFSVLSDEVLQVWTEFSPVVKECVAEQDKGPYQIAIKGIEGAYFVVASEYPNSEPFDSLSDAENYVEKNYGRFLVDGGDYTEDLQSLQDELWRVWCTVNKVSIDHPLTPDDLSKKGKELLEVAVIGKRITELEVAIQLWGLDSAFSDHIMNWKEEKLFWACQVYLNPDGSLQNNSNAISFRNRLKSYCGEKSIVFATLENKFLEKVSSLPFYPVYDWLFTKEIEHSKCTSINIGTPRDQAIPTQESERNSVAKNRLLEFFEGTFDGVKRLLLIVGVIVLGAGAQHCTRDYFREQRTESTRSVTEGDIQKKYTREEIQEMKKELEKIHKQMDGQ